MATAILQYIIKFAASEALDGIKKLVFKPDTTLLDTLAKGFGGLEQLIKEIDYQNKLWEPMNKIKYWTGRISVVIDDLKKAETPEHIAAYDGVINALKDESDGIRYQTFSLYNVLVTEKSPISSDGLLKYWADVAYKKLANENDMKYHTVDYVRELDTNIAAVAILLQLGMQLAMYIASTVPDAESFRAKAEERVKSFTDMLYNTYYPPALRQIKTSYADPGTWLTNGQWFNIYDESDKSNQNYLSIHDYWIRKVAIHTPAGDHSAKLRAFRFAVPNPEVSLGPLEMHAYWDSGGQTRVLFYDGNPDGLHRVFAYTNSQSSHTQDIFFKLIPIQVDTTTDRTPLKLIPYKVDDGTKTRADDLNTWGYTWRLAPTSSPI